MEGVAVYILEIVSFCRVERGGVLIDYNNISKIESFSC